MSRDAKPIDVIEGRARWCVVQGDALAVLAELPNGSVDAVVTDPPYASVGDSASVMTNPDGVRLVPREVQFYESWAREHLAEWIRVLAPDGACWFTCDWRGAMTFDLAASKLGVRSVQVGVWDRGGLGMGSILRRTWESFVVIPKPGFIPISTSTNDLWRYEWSPSHRLGVHGAEKPVVLMRKAISTVSRPDRVVLDPFTGSGTTGVACALEGRRFIGIERDVDHVETAVDRINASITGADWKNPRQGALFAASTKAEPSPGGGSAT